MSRPFVTPETTPLFTVPTGRQRRVLRSEQMEMQYSVGRAGESGPSLHVHASEQCSIVIEGSYEFLMGTRSWRVGVGDVVLIPPHVPHGAGMVYEDSVTLDFIAPPRDDYEPAAAPLER